MLFILLPLQQDRSPRILIPINVYCCAQRGIKVPEDKCRRQNFFETHEGCLAYHGPLQSLMSTFSVLE